MMKINRLFLTVIAALTATTAQSQQRLTLDDLFTELIDNNYTLQISAERTRQANNNISLSPMLPTVSATARQSYNTMSNKTNTLGAGASLGWRLFDGFGMFATYDLGKSQFDLQKLYEIESVEEMVRQVINQYYLIVSLNSRARVARESVELSRRRYEEALLRYSLEVLSGLEMKLAKTDLNADSTYLIRQIEALDIAYTNLNSMLNFDYLKRGYIKDSITVDKAINKSDIEKLVIENNTPILIARKGIVISDLNLKLAKAAAFPTLDLAAGYNYSAVNDIPSSTFRESDGFNVGFTLGVKIFDGFDVQRNIRSSKISQNISIISQKDVESSILASLNNQYINYANNLQLIDFERENAEAMRLNLEVAMERYRLGELSGIDFRNIQQQYLASEDRRINALYLAKLSEVALQTLSGSLVAASLTR